MLDLGADLGQRFGEVRHAFVLVFVADFAPVRVVAGLLAPARIAAGGLQVPVGVRGDPHVDPGRWDYHRFDALQRVLVRHRGVMGIHVAEGVMMLHAPDAGRVIRGVAQTGCTRKGLRIGRRINLQRDSG